MPRACRRNLLLRVLIAAALAGSLLSGCGRSKPVSMSLGDWIAVLDDKAGIHQFDADTPYYMNVGENSPYYESVQAAVEWKVLDPATAFDPDAALTREWAAYTLMNLWSTELKTDTGTKIRDVSKSRFPRHISAAVASGLMKTDKHSRFRPDEIIDRMEALGMLETVVNHVNNRVVEQPSLTFDWGESVQFTNEEPESVDVEAGTAVFSQSADVAPGKYFSAYTPYSGYAKDYGSYGNSYDSYGGTSDSQSSISKTETEGSESGGSLSEEDYDSPYWFNSDGTLDINPSELRLFKVEEVQEDPETGKKNAVIRPAEPEDVFASLETANSFTIDFSQAEIIDAIDGTVIQAAPVSYTENSSVSLMSCRTETYTKNHTINGFEISYSVSSDGMNASVAKQTDNGMKIMGSFLVTDVTPTYELNMKNLKLQDGYLKVDFVAVESLGISAEKYMEVYGDFSKVNPKDFLGTVKNMFQEKKDSSEIEVPLAVINVPVPNVPAVTVTLTMLLKLSANGKAELTLTQNNSLGMEIRDGKLRDISSRTAKAEATIHANTAIEGAVRLAMKTIGMSIMDITAEAGAKADVSTTVHAYDKNGNHAVMSDSEVPSDLADDLAQGNGNVLTCADLKAYKTADIELNSEGSMLGKLGLSATIPILNGEEEPLIPGKKTHMENGHFVDKCTRKDRLKKVENEKVVVSDQIRISTYSILTTPGESNEIKVIALPKGYSVSDLVYSSDRPEVASISGGVVQAGQEGSAIIRIRTSDGKFEVSCTVLVRKQT